MKVRFLSYNVGSGRGMDGKFDARRSLREIQAASADVVSVQEVAINHPAAVSPENYPCLAEEMLGMNVIFTKTMDLDKGGAFGVMLASRFQLEKVAELVMPVPDSIEPRRALIAKVLAPEPFYAVSTHLSYNGECDGDDEIRRASVQTIHDYIAANKLFPCVMMGDLNAAPNTPAIRFLREHDWQLCNDAGKGEPTAKTGKYGWLEIDYVAVCPKAAAKAFSFYRNNLREASDHYYISSEVTFSK